MITSLSSVPAKRFLHYYFYVLDPIMRPMSLCVASYLPFSVNCFMNGHSYVAGELRRPGVAFRMEDNAIIRCADPDLLITIAERLDERILQQRANFWASRLAPRFSARERANCQLHYQWSVGAGRIRDRVRSAVRIGDILCCQPIGDVQIVLQCLVKRGRPCSGPLPLACTKPPVAYGAQDRTLPGTVRRNKGPPRPR